MHFRHLSRTLRFNIVLTPDDVIGCLGQGLETVEQTVGGGSHSLHVRFGKLWGLWGWCEGNDVVMVG